MYTCCTCAYFDKGTEGGMYASVSWHSQESYGLFYHHHIPGHCCFCCSPLTPVVYMYTHAITLHAMGQTHNVMHACMHTYIAVHTQCMTVKHVLRGLVVSWCCLYYRVMNYCGILPKKAQCQKIGCGA